MRDDDLVYRCPRQRQLRLGENPSLLTISLFHPHTCSHTHTITDPQHHTQPLSTCARMQQVLHHIFVGLGGRKEGGRGLKGKW